MVSLITTAEIEEIFTNHERLKKKSSNSGGAGNTNSVESRVSYPHQQANKVLSLSLESLVDAKARKP